MMTEVLCHRCHRPGHVTWVDVRSFSQAEPEYLHGESYCLTPGCVDETGSRRLEPPSPSELRERADRAWLNRQRALAAEYARVARQLEEATTGW